MLDHEFIASGLVVWIRGEHLGSLDKGVVGGRRVGVGCCGGVVERGEYTGGTLSLDQFAYYGVVED